MCGIQVTPSPRLLSGATRHLMARMSFPVLHILSRVTLCNPAHCIIIGVGSPFLLLVIQLLPRQI